MTIPSEQTSEDTMTEIEFDGVWFKPTAVVAVKLCDNGVFSTVDVLLKGGHTIKMGEDSYWEKGEAGRIAERFARAMSAQADAGADFATFEVGAAEEAK